MAARQCPRCGTTFDPGLRAAVIPNQDDDVPWFYGCIEGCTRCVIGLSLLALVFGSLAGLVWRGAVLTEKMTGAALVPLVFLGSLVGWTLYTIFLCGLILVAVDIGRTFRRIEANTRRQRQE